MTWYSARPLVAVSNAKTSNVQSDTLDSIHCNGGNPHVNNKNC